jgi:uncharacterized protein (DUF58 family)
VRIPRPTALGVKAALFYLLLLAAFFAARYSNLFFLLLAFLSVLGLYGLAAALHNLARLEGAIAPLDPVPAGAGAPFQARLAAGRRTRFAVSVELDLEGHGPVATAAHLLRGAAVVAGEIPPLPRGLYAVRDARAASTWPFGLLHARARLAAPERLVVYPAPLEGDAAGGPGAGDDAAAAPQDGFLQPSGLREFREGDEPRRIHWKASARRRGLVLLEWEGGSGGGPEVVLDRRAEPDALEHALRVLAGLALRAKESKEPMKLHTQGLRATFGPGHRPWEELLAFLAVVESLPPGGEPPPPAAAHVPRLPRSAAAHAPRPPRSAAAHVPRPPPPTGPSAVPPGPPVRPPGGGA